MLRVRDELRMTLMAYQTLYESSIAFGIRKALKAEAGKAEMEAYISKLELEKTKLDKEVSGVEMGEGRSNVSPFRLVTSRFSVKWWRRKLSREDRRKRRLTRKRLITSRRQVNNSSLNWRGSFIRNKASVSLK